ncbi:adenylosuccinate synthetase [Luteolibacter sp. SL250]|uniref:adenylosuccinate synthetase n=1 Tax=Luteolibacter sp. SL250 TaxID=2995170 RepID=UPI002271D6F2|nr:adenylosuccinate synthetase [Luteolibacter sp. SL250]WAC20041.1 adenylosuccinate synthetase [Luteolibacter sp. SL250]
MSGTRHASVLGLGFGDCGKGHFVHALARRWQAHTVVRFSGGAQAGHNVVARSTDGALRHHTFSQFGSGTFLPGVRTLLVDPMVVHPTALLVEAEALRLCGVDDALARMMIDGRCRVTTPFHQAAGRLREIRRGASAHGTCGVGVGETVHHGLLHPEQSFRYEDLLPSGKASALEKLEAIRTTLLDEFSGEAGPLAEEEMAALEDGTLAARWWGIAVAVARQCPPARSYEVAARLELPGCVIHEGAQGILLDEWHGFHPHTTWSSITTAALGEALGKFGIRPEIRHHGVLRTYFTRHGAGPFPTHDRTLDPMLGEPHNASDGWQGEFRRGHPDGVLLDHALRSVGRLDGLLVSHLDVFRKGVRLKWCGGYDIGGNPEPLRSLPEGKPRDLAHQESLTRLLQGATPRYEADHLCSEEDYLARLDAATPLPVVATSCGPEADDVRFR